MDHIYQKRTDDRLPGFQVVREYGPDHGYCKLSTPKKSLVKRKRDTLTPTGKTPKQPHKKMAPLLDETVKRIPWSTEEKKMLVGLSKKKNEGESEATFWERCAAKINISFPEKKKSASSCKCAVRRLCLSENHKTLDRDDVDLFTEQLSTESTEITHTKDSATQTDWSIPVNYKSSPKEREWVFMEPKKTIQTSVKGVQRLHQTAVKRLGRFADLEDKDRTDLIQAMCTCSSRQVASKLLCSSLRGEILLQTLYDIESDAKECCNKDSVLSQKNYNNMCNFNWDLVTEELLSKQPLLTEILLSVALPSCKIGNQKATESVMPVICTVYGMLMKQRYQELSLVQKIVSMTLANEKKNRQIRRSNFLFQDVFPVPSCFYNTHFSVYDRLQPLGITLGHSGMLYTMDHISGHFNSELIDSLKVGKSFRLVGDNINFQVNVSHARKSSERVGHMEHWFGSAAIVQNLTFDHLPSETPQCDLNTLPITNFIIDENEWEKLTGDMTKLLGRVLTEFFPWLKFAQKAANKEIMGEYSHSHNMSTKNKVVPLPIRAKNEQKYADVVDILDDYESLLHTVYEDADTELQSVHIGGDQLTRERFSGAKRLRAAAFTPSEKFAHLTPITFELFHLQMTVLTTFYQILYNTSNTEPFTLHAQKIRLMRKDADGNDVKNHYNHCKELAVSFVKAFWVEAACMFFNVPDTNTKPNIDFPDVSTMSESQIQIWLEELLRPMVKEILQDSRTHLAGVNKPGELPIHGGSGDMVTDHGKIVLELGLVFMELNDIVKTPDRDRLLLLMKYLMVLLKAHNNRSKYALEIMRLLCQQYALLSERCAHLTLYGLFVNTGGKINTHIPADLQMEYLVRLTKGHLKSMCSNVSEQTMKKRSSAFFGMQEICDNYDSQTNVLKRAQKHKIPSSFEDEKRIINDLRAVRPFQHTLGRRIESLKKAPRNPVTKLDLEGFVKWIENNKFKFYYEIGQ